MFEQNTVSSLLRILFEMDLITTKQMLDVKTLKLSAHKALAK